MSLKDDTRKLIIEYQRRLQKLKEQKAKLGINTPPAILTEIEDVETEIEQLHIELNTIEEEDLQTEPFDETAPQQRTRFDRQDRSSAGSDGTATGGDIITVGDVGAGAAVAAGRHADASVQSAPQPSDFMTSLTKWQAEIDAKIDALPDLSPPDKQDLKKHIDKIKGEVAKGEQANPNRLEKLINVVGVMGPDIFEVVVATLTSPLAGIGLVLKKIGDRVKLESKPKNP
jgi:hypothetical protein